MNEDYSHSPKLLEQVVRRAVKGEPMPSPGVRSLDFLKSLARNFKVELALDKPLQNFVLN